MAIVPHDCHAAAFAPQEKFSAVKRQLLGHLPVFLRCSPARSYVIVEGKGREAMKGTTRLLALCGVLTALGVVLLCLGGIVPFALYICPILASIALLPVRSRPRYAWCCYGAIALLGLLLCPDKEVSLLFCFTGYYPLLKPRLDALRSRLLTLTLKLLWAAVSMAALYALILYVFCLPAVVEEFAATGRWLLAATIAMGVALFFVYDVLLGRLMARWPAKV